MNTEDLPAQIIVIRELLKLLGDERTVDIRILSDLGRLARVDQ
ncbi:MAG TPA: hypothetical protein VKJ01_15130 [Candidatus Solibacter sp.]|nr:hypothetical protein [Candidatus Solibacter sp.]